MRDATEMMRLAMADDLHLGNDDDSILSAHSESSESSWSSFTSMSTQQSYDDSDVDVEDDDPAAVPIFGLSKEQQGPSCALWTVFYKCGLLAELAHLFVW